MSDHDLTILQDQQDELAAGQPQQEDDLLAFDTTDWQQQLFNRLQAAGLIPPGQVYQP